MFSKFNNKKVPVSDKINNQIVKFLDASFPNLFPTIANKCHKFQVFRDCWKVANIKRLPESGKDISSLSDCRLVSLLNSIGKVHEKVINEILLKEADINLFYQNQFDFRRDLPTKGALYKLI